MKKKEKKNNVMLILGIMLIALIVTVGYAALQANLEINGTARLGNATWNVKFDNIRTYGTDNVTPTLAPYITDSLTEVRYSVDISQPGDKYEFLVDVKNTGTIDAILDSYDLSDTGRTDVIYTVKEMVSNTPVEIDWDNFELNQNETRTLLVSVVYDRDLASAGSLGTSAVIDLTLDLDFVQA